MKLKSYLRNNKDYPPYSENPFITEILKQRRIKVTRRLNKSFIKDDRSFCKMYQLGLIKLLELSSFELKVYLYLMSKITYGSDYVYFYREECNKVCQFKTPSVIDTAIAGLMDKRFICKSEHKHKFWINPDIMMKGPIAYPIITHIRGYSNTLSKKLEVDTEKDEEIINLGKEEIIVEPESSQSSEISDNTQDYESSQEISPDDHLWLF